MNKKIIALAVAGALTAPLLVQADDAGPTLYGRVNLAIGVYDDDLMMDADDNLIAGDTNYDVTDVVSRFGIKGEEDLGNGLSAIYRYEFRVNADEGSLRSAATSKTQRLSYVGLKGNFGQVTLGSQWSTFYNMVGSYLDPTYTLGYFGYSSYMGGDYRIDNSIQYSKSFGPVAISTTVQLDGGNGVDRDADRWSVGASYDAGPVSFHAAYDAEKTELEDLERAAIVARFSVEGISINLGYQTLETDDDVIDRDMWTINGSVNVGSSTSLFAQYWDGNGDGTGLDGLGDIDVDGIVLGVYHKLSDRTKLYFEGTHVSPDFKPSADIKRYLFGVRHDF